MLWCTALLILATGIISTSHADSYHGDSHESHSHENNDTDWTSKVQHQFDTADIIWYGSDITDCGMEEVCMNQTNCDNTTLSGDMSDCNMTVVCENQTRNCYPRSHIHFHVMCVLRDGGWMLMPHTNVEIGLMKNDSATMLDEKYEGMMYVFVKRMKDGDKVMYDWSEDMGVPAVYNGEIDTSMQCNLANSDQKDCEQQPLMTKRCEYECEHGWFRHHDMCYKIGSMMSSKQEGMETCESWNSELAMLNKRSYDAVKDWFMDDGDYWISNMYSGDTQVNGTIPWDDEGLSSEEESDEEYDLYDVRVNKEGLRVVTTPNSQAMPLCTKKAMHYMGFREQYNMATDYDFTFKTTGKVYGRCCEKPSAVKPASLAVNFNNRMSGNMTQATAEYMITSPLPHITKPTAGKTHLVVMFESSGMMIDMGTQDSPYLMLMAKLMFDSMEELYPYDPILPRSMMPAIYHLKIYDITGMNMNHFTQAHIMQNYVKHLSAHAASTNCTRCFFYIHQFEEDLNLMASTSLTWQVLPDVSTADMLYREGKLREGGVICDHVYPGGVDANQLGLHLCEAPVGGTEVYRVFTQLIILAVIIVFMLK